MGDELIKRYPRDFRQIWLFSIRVLSYDFSLKIWSYLGLPGQPEESNKINVLAKEYYQKTISQKAKNILQWHIAEQELIEIINSFQNSVAECLGEQILIQLRNWIMALCSMWSNSIADGRSMKFFFDLLRTNTSVNLPISVEKFCLVVNKISEELDIRNQFIAEFNAYELSEWDANVERFFQLEDIIGDDLESIFVHFSAIRIWQFISLHLSQDEIRNLKSIIPP